jgi:glycosyltransferase involved in cell wall biosynthesis
MDISLYANDGSPLGVIPEFINGRGVGGAELSMMSWAKTMATRGHKVTIFNNPIAPGEYDGVTYLPQTAYNPMVYQDVFIVYRSPNPYIREAKAGLKIHWSTDQYTIGDYSTDIFPFVDKVVCISPYHVDYHSANYDVADDKIGYIDLGVNIEEYTQQVEKIPGRCIFCSIPDRGLKMLRGLWPQIKEARPDASLVITSDYRLWGNLTPGNNEHRMAWLHQPDIIFLGRINRPLLIREQLAAQVQSYPCTYEEMFCISTAECQVAGTYPVTSNAGALRTTNEWGTIIEGLPADRSWQQAFVDSIVSAMSISDTLRQVMRAEAQIRFDWNSICEKWEQLIETGAYVDHRVRV